MPSPSVSSFSPNQINSMRDIPCIDTLFIGEVNFEAFLHSTPATTQQIRDEATILRNDTASFCGDASFEEGTASVELLSPEGLRGIGWRLPAVRMEGYKEGLAKMMSRKRMLSGSARGRTGFCNVFINLLSIDGTADVFVHLLLFDISDVCNSVAPLKSSSVNNIVPM
ncbi:hypothetical protein KCV03_g365, partial [Aureobasidium melanogenum]